MNMGCPVIFSVGFAGSRSARSREKTLGLAAGAVSHMCVASAPDFVWQK